MSKTTSGSVTLLPGMPHTLQEGKPGLGGVGGTNVGAITGAGVTGAEVTAVPVGTVIGAGVLLGTAHPHGVVKEEIIGQKTGSMKPESPAIWKFSQLTGS
mmetsp:Transcript_32085/g.73768  ORF Transcript_32085/g.73768 Transcript_32085/m.73768 type:complete len:100 (+) Transcript_32085:77-376(+)